MLIAIGFCLLVVWLVFFKFKLLPWNWPWRVITALTMVVIVGVIIALLNRYAPTGRVTVLGRVIEITPNVTGTITDVPVSTKVIVPKGTVLFRIDPAPYEAKVKKLTAELAAARQAVKQFDANADVAQAEVDALQTRLAHAETRRADMERLAKADAASAFRLQDVTAEANLLTAQLIAARARLTSAELARDSTIGSKHTTVLQIEAQLEDAAWQLGQTTVRAPADGYATLLPLGVGHMATPNRAAMSFIVADEIALVGVFPQNGFSAIRPGAAVMIVFADQPGSVHKSTVETVIRGVGEGQLLASGNLERVSGAEATKEFPVLINVPEGIDPDLLRPGVSGKATVFDTNAGVIGKLGEVLIRVAAVGAYL
ncbi:HlyD family secretion protein [Mesorhizobium sp. L-8-3]|uniref:HlyD family secretion protein n=1 Tax=Mesorhizobium sp. L-8-3 TaxID=2744522 RepID=UPI0019253498|nr:biotin/lipoyl-binding protein [Mesorhizobium sp. L-8-3]BCH24566.1 MFP transporter [Mesorhizobium sp. L-8-3]